MPFDFSLHFGLVLDNSSVVHSRHVSACGHCNSLTSRHVAQGTAKLSCDLFMVLIPKALNLTELFSVVVLPQIVCNVLGCVLLGGEGLTKKINKYTYVQTM